MKNLNEKFQGSKLEIKEDKGVDVNESDYRNKIEEKDDELKKVVWGDMFEIKEKMREMMDLVDDKWSVLEEKYGF